MNTSELLATVKARNPNEPEFLQAAEEVILSIAPVIEKKSGIRAVENPGEDA